MLVREVLRRKFACDFCQFSEGLFPKTELAPNRLDTLADRIELDSNAQRGWNLIYVQFAAHAKDKPLVVLAISFVVAWLRALTLAEGGVAEVVGIPYTLQII
jgi:hypothetical protein